jgi:ketosteroid isomerase-like protein
LDVFARETDRGAMGNEELRAVVDGIDAAVDAKDWARCRAYFTDTLTVDFGEPTERTADGLIAEWAAILHRAKRSHHLRTHHAYEGNDSAAAVYSHAYIINVLDGHVWELWATFVHRLVRMQAGWRCAGMDVAVSHTRGDERVRADRVTGV